MEALNSEVLVVVSPVVGFVGHVSVGQRVVLVDTRSSGDHGQVNWYQNAKGEMFTLPAARARQAIKPLSGPRKQ